MTLRKKRYVKKSIEIKKISKKTTENERKIGFLAEGKKPKKWEIIFLR